MCDIPLYEYSNYPGASNFEITKTKGEGQSWSLCTQELPGLGVLV